MESREMRWLNCIEGTGERVRVSRELSAKSLQSLRRSRELVLRSKTLLAQEQQIVQAKQNNAHAPAFSDAVENRPTRAPFSPAKKAQDSTQVQGLEVVSDRCIEGEVVSMDDKHFVDCDFVNCTLQYSGQPVILESTRFEHCGFQFSGEAAMTARFLECFQLLPEDTVEYASARSVSGSMRPN